VFLALTGHSTVHDRTGHDKAGHDTTGRNKEDAA